MSESVFRQQKYLICNSVCERLELQTLQTLIRGSAQTTQVQTCVPEQLLGSLVACQPQKHGDAYQCK